MTSSDPFRFEPLAESPVLVTGGRGVRVGDAARILDSARAEADELREAARREGFEAGYADGLAAADERLAPAVQLLAAAHAALGEERGRAADAVEAHAVELALRIAEKAIGAAFTARPEHVADVVQGALRRLIERDRVLVLVHPDDLELLRGAAAELKRRLGGIGELEIQAERRVGRGGAIVRTAAGEVDARLETQLGRARETLVAALREEPGA